MHHPLRPSAQRCWLLARARQAPPKSSALTSERRGPKSGAFTGGPMCSSHLSWPFTEACGGGVWNNSAYRQCPAARIIPFNSAGHSTSLALLLSSHLASPRNRGGSHRCLPSFSNAWAAGLWSSPHEQHQTQQRIGRANRRNSISDQLFCPPCCSVRHTGDFMGQRKGEQGSL